MRILLVLLVAVYVNANPISDIELENGWRAFKTKFGKKYRDNIEEERRKTIFHNEWNKIAEHNEKFEKGEVNYGLGINQFADRTTIEVQQIAGSVDKVLQSPKKKHNFRMFKPPKNVTVPDSFDWRTKGAVTPVKNQWHCGSCYAFASIAAVESHYFIKYGQLKNFSEQSIVDCSENLGCAGGIYQTSYKYMMEKGVVLEKDYSYRAYQDTCKYNPKDKVTTIKGWVEFEAFNEEHMKIAVATVGPLAVTFHNSFVYYSEGVISSTECSNDPLKMSHGVLIVGYGTDKKTNQDYWLMKNSYGSTFGENGYMRIARNKNMCGIAVEVTYPIL